MTRTINNMAMEYIRIYLRYKEKQFTIIILLRILKWNYIYQIYLYFFSLIKCIFLPYILNNLRQKYLDKRMAKLMLWITFKTGTLNKL